jgi:hypothetical protein
MNSNMKSEEPAKTTREVPTAGMRPDLRSAIAVRVAQIAVMFLVQGVALFWGAGRLAWTWGWLYLGIYLASVLIVMLRISPETIAERGRPTGVKNWDKVVGGLWSLAQFLTLPMVAGLDVRFGWTKAPGIAWHVAGAAGFAAGLALFGRAMVTNAFFSSVARTLRAG